MFQKFPAEMISYGLDSCSLNKGVGEEPQLLALWSLFGEVVDSDV